MMKPISSIAIWALMSLSAVGAEKMRGGYLATNNLELVPKMQEVGLNTAIVKFGWLEAPVDAEQERMLSDWATACKQHEIAFLPCFNFFGGHEKKWAKDYRRYVDADGRERPLTPCPLDEKFWRATVRARFVELARRPGIPGAALDLEMYGAESTNYGGGCQCANCRRLTTDRALEDAVAALAAECREAVHATRPEFVIGGLLMDKDAWMARGCARGFSTPARPAVAFSERTYGPGFTDYVPRTVERLREKTNGTLLSCGLWHSKFPADNVAEQLYHLAQNSHGYWVYTLQTFEKPSYAPLPGPHAGYWAAMKKANAELDRLAADPAYQSPLAIRGFEMPAPLLAADMWKSVRAAPAGLAGESATPARLRGRHLLYAHAAQGEAVAFNLTLVRLGSYRDRGAALLLAPDGRELARAELSAGKETALRAKAGADGVCGLLIDSGANTIRIDRPAGWAVRADGPGAHFCTSFKKAVLLATASTVGLRFETTARGEGLHCVARDAKGKTLKEIDVVGKTDVTLTAQPGEFITLSFTKLPGAVFEDLTIVVRSGAEPFIATAPGGLLKRR